MLTDTFMLLSIYRLGKWYVVYGIDVQLRISTLKSLDSF